MDYPDPSKFSKEEQDRLLAYLKALRAESMPRRWYGMASNKQLPPDHPRHHLPWVHPKTGIVYSCVDRNPHCTGLASDWVVWIFCGGRGGGKTMAGANWIIEMALSEPNIDVAVCAPTFAAVQRVCFEGSTGIIRQAEDGDIKSYNRNNVIIYMRNGSRILGFSAENPDSIRGSNLTYAWCDELAAFQNDEFYTHGLSPALRIDRANGEPPRMMITTTPKNMNLMLELIKKAGKDPAHYHITRSTSYENPTLSDEVIARIQATFGSNMAAYKQEIEAELIDDDRKLFKQGDFDKYRVSASDAPRDYRQVVIGVDPATTSKEDSDYTGVVVIGESGEGVNHHSYVLEDCSVKGTPDVVMTTIQSAFYRYSADLVIVESNKAGDYFRTLMAQKDPFIPVRDVHAAKGKKVRAMHISHLNEIGRIHMTGEPDDFLLLEEQLCKMDSDQDRDKVGDDRADACLAKGTPVLTITGEVPIEKIVPGNLVWTRAGWKPVTATRCTQRNAEVMTALLSDGRTLTGTRDHRVWTEDNGWRQMDSLVWGDILSGWTNTPPKSSSKASPIVATRTAHNGITGSIISAEPQMVSPTCTATSGSTRTPARKSRLAGTSTIKMRTRSITTRQISSRQPNTWRFIQDTVRINLSTWSASVLLLLNGTLPKLVTSGILAMESIPGKQGNLWARGPAKSVARNSPPGLIMRDTARAVASTERLNDDCGSRPSASSAAINICRTARVVARPVPVSVVGSYVNSGRRDVYDLTVADVHEFTASGVVVHNCVWAMVYLAGKPSVDWEKVYGFGVCKHCSADVSFLSDKNCRSCGEPVVADKAEAQAIGSGEKSAVRWWHAYAKKCPRGHEPYPMKLKSCPKCEMSPDEFLRQALAFSGAGKGGPGYSGRRDWLSGRRI